MNTIHTQMIDEFSCNTLLNESESEFLIRLAWYFNTRQIKDFKQNFTVFTLSFQFIDIFDSSSFSVEFYFNQSMKRWMLILTIVGRKKIDMTKQLVLNQKKNKSLEDEQWQGNRERERKMEGDQQILCYIKIGHFD